MDEIMSITTDKLGKGVHILLALFLIGIVTGLMSCTNELPADHPKVEKEMVPIQFKLSRGLGGDGGVDDYYIDYHIESIRILEFRTDGTLENQWSSKEGQVDIEKVRYYKEDNPPKGQIFEIEPSDQEKTVVVVANETDGMTTYFKNLPLNSTHLQDVRAHLVSDVFGEGSYNLNYSYTNHMVMAGERKHPAVKGVVNNAKGVLLNRILAKVTLQIQKAEEIKEVPINIKSVKLTKLNSGSKLLDSTGPTENTIEETFDWHSYSDGDNLPANYVDPLEMEPIYTYERRLPNDANGEKKAPVLVVNATYNGIPTTYYAHLDGGTGEYSLIRNMHYKITATIKGLGDSGLLIKTDVAPWKYVGYKEKYEELVFVQNDGGGNFDFTKEQKTSFDHPLKLRVIIKGYPHTVWKATLTNGYDFMFIGASSGIADGKTPVEITIKPRSKSVHVDKTCQVFFTVAGHEVPNAKFKVIQKAGE